MLTISKVFTFPSSLPVWEYRIPWQLSKQISELFIQTSAQVYSVPGQTEGRKKVFLEWTSIDLHSKLSLRCNINYYKRVIHTARKVSVFGVILVRIFAVSSYSYSWK